MGTPKSEDSPPDSGLEKAALAASEATWFTAWLKSAAVYLAAVTTYLGVATALVIAVKKYLGVEKADLTIYLLAGILALPLLFAFLFNLLPAIRRRREASLRPTGTPEKEYFTTAPREDDEHGFFASGYDDFVAWAAAPSAPLLHLTGLSGSGKSSLIAACLRPRLAAGIDGTKTAVLIVRSYTDPLAALRTALLGQWKKKPDDYDTLSPLDALRRAARQLDRDERLLIALDQFEEFFLLRAQAGGAEGAPLVPEAEVAPVRDFLHAVLADPPEGIALLLSYRWDHQGLLDPLRLPARTDAKNHRTVAPLDFATAAAFIRGCPGLVIPEARMERVLREAARQEGGRVVMRPIVANLLGLMLQKMAGHPTLWRRSSDLLRGYVTDTIGGELIETRARILRALVTDFHTAQARDLTSLAAETRLPRPLLSGQVETLGHAGLVRCVNLAEPDSSRRVWQVSHDFLATLIERVLDGTRRTLWRTLRPWLFPAAMVLAVAAGVLWPLWQKAVAIDALTNAGFTWNYETGEIAAAHERARRIQSLAPLVAHLARLEPKSLDLSDCEVLQDVEVLKGLTGLTSLNLSSCAALKDVEVLKGLTGLTSLNLSFCGELKDVEVLKDLTGLTTLDLSFCRELKDVEVLKDLTGLTTLDLSGCEVLEDVEVLKDLAGLTSLNLSRCYALQNVEGLKGLTGLTTLDLSGCRELQNVEGLQRLTGLTSLNLSSCDALQNVEGLQGLTGLTTLNLFNCRALKDVGGLKGVTGLIRLDLTFCDQIPPAALRELRVALPKTEIRFPNLEKEPPKAP